MKVIKENLSVRSSKRSGMIDVTGRVEEFVGKSGIRSGICIVYCPHTTAAVTINESADPDVARDLLRAIEKLAPRNHPEYRHNEGNSDAHIKSSLVGCSVNVPIDDGKVLLGAWQGIFFCEFDGPRNRNLTIQVYGQ